MATSARPRSRKSANAAVVREPVAVALPLFDGVETSPAGDDAASGAAGGAEPEGVPEDGPGASTAASGAAGQASDDQEATPRKTRPPRAFGDLLNPHSDSAFPKSLGAIHIRRVSGDDYTLLDEQIWCLLIGHAYSTMLDVEEHVISYGEIKKQWSNRMRLRGDKAVSVMDGNTHESNDRIRESLDRLQKTLVRWDVYGEEGTSLPNGRITTQLLGSTHDVYGPMGGCVLHYTFPLHLRRLLADPKRYAYLRSRAVYSFTSVYALRLYQCLQMVADLDFPKMLKADIPKLRGLLRVPDGTLSEFSNLKLRAIKPAIDQINAFSQFTVNVEYVRAKTRGGPVESVIFHVLENKKGDSFYDEIVEENRSKFRTLEHKDALAAPSQGGRKDGKAAKAVVQRKMAEAEGASPVSSPKRRTSFKPSN